MKTGSKRGRWVALGTLLGVVAAWGGFGLVGAATSAPTTVTTCTKASTGKTKVIEASGAAKCNAKGKGVAKKWGASSADVHRACVNTAFLWEGATKLDLFLNPNAPPSGPVLADLTDPAWLSVFPACVGHSTG